MCRRSVGINARFDRSLIRRVVGVEAHREPIRRNRVEALEAVSTGPVHQPENELACLRVEDEQVCGAIAVVVR